MGKKVCIYGSQSPSHKRNYWSTIMNFDRLFTRGIWSSLNSVQVDLTPLALLKDENPKRRFKEVKLDFFSFV